MHGVLRKAFKFRCREEAGDQALAHQPGWRALNAIFAANHLGLYDGCRRAVIGKGSVQVREDSTRLTCVPVNHDGILEVLTEDKVRFK
jgi:hypothetical protein